MFDFLDDTLDKETENEFVREISEDIVNTLKEWKENNVHKNLEAFREIQDIRGLIYECLTFGRLFDLETGESFWVTDGLREIDKILETVTDEKYLAYELKRKDELIEIIRERIRQAQGE